MVTLTIEVPDEHAAALAAELGTRRDALVDGMEKKETAKQSVAAYIYVARLHAQINAGLAAIAADPARRDAVRRVQRRA
jgi:hypothetical protein